MKGKLLSKTFEALQRAARDRAAREPRLPEAETPRPVPETAPPTVGEARLRLLSEVKPPVPVPIREPAAVMRGVSLTRTGDLCGEIDVTLRRILEDAFMSHSPGLIVEDNGWIRGRLQYESLVRLLDMHDLLHCLLVDDENSFWFWGSAREARELAELSGYELDPV